MGMYRVKVIKLRKRTAPVSNQADKSNIAGYVFEGNIIEATEIKEQTNNLGKWFRDKEGFYYWGEGLEEVGGKDIFNYRESITDIIPEIYKNNKSNKRIIIIDDGVTIDNNIHNTNLIEEIDLTGNSLAEKHHGTFICGIIAGDGVVKGILPEARILSIKYKEPNMTVNDILSNMILALEKIKTIDEALIINISQGFKRFLIEKNRTSFEKISELIDEISKKDTLIFCSAGDNEELLDEYFLFPAYNKNTISVGSISSIYTKLNFSKNLDIVTPLVYYHSYNFQGKIITDSGSSFATAIIASMAAILFSNKSENLSKQNYLSKIKGYSTGLNSFNYKELKKFQFHYF